ncbi:MAG TPA: energy transducer TonB [Verrucomicrobiota bacterium]|nr:energy transducer TonB [Verrucomicrobiota bacterium]HRZ34864.1 energy transducer TonB [Candidatus Paceibacterota bacterium]HRZ55843.1 energy transducer TonB [Candidatus Paceibacterota bacterium]
MSRNFDTSGEVATGAVFALVLWVGCLVIGLLGLTLAYQRPRPAVRASAPIPMVEMIEVEVANLPLSLPAPSQGRAAAAMPTPPARSTPAPPPSPAPIEIPPAPPFLAVDTAPLAAPSRAPAPAVAFPVPIETPDRSASPTPAAHSGSATSTAAFAPPFAVHSLTVGRAEGRQPAPEYPPAAMRGGQEGTVRIGFGVGAHGRVVDAAVVAPSPWPLLNQAALRTVRDRWRFHPGGVRRFEVSIHFRLEK